MKVDKDQISAWGVHAFTGSGAILGFLALISILNNDQVGSFLWLGMALLYACSYIWSFFVHFYQR